MSKESSPWLNIFTMIGDTDKRGTAWHFRASDQGDEPNHYPGAIPVEDIRRRLFGWEPVSGSVTSSGTNENGGFTITDASRQAIMRPPGALGPDDEGGIMGVASNSYPTHSYGTYLLDTVSEILDSGLHISSAGLLRQGAQAWVEVGVPDDFTTPEGVEFRPNMLATTSYDQSLPTAYKRTVTNTVCDNTLAAARREDGQEYRVKHTKYSIAKLVDARAALNLVYSIADDFAAEVAEMTSVKVSDGDWARFLDAIAPIPVDDTGKAKVGRGLTMAENKRSDLNQLWRADERVAPWTGTAWGAVAAVNTYAHHVQAVRGRSRAERNMGLMVSGGFEDLDRQSREAILSIAG